VLAVVLILVSMQTTGNLAIASMALVGLCNSIMFPTIFTLGIQGLKAGQEKKRVRLAGDGDFRGGDCAFIDRLAGRSFGIAPCVYIAGDLLCLHCVVWAKKFH